MFGYRWSPPKPKAPPEVFKAGVVIHWSNGTRATILSEDLNAATFRVWNFTSRAYETFTRDYVENNAWPTDVQPGQKYQSPNRVWKVGRSRSSTEWWCEIDGGDSKEYSLRESELLGWTRVDGLGVGIGSAPPPTHGPHICPRCGSAGALILLNDVVCMNKTCTWYSAVVDIKCWQCKQAYWTVNNKPHACRKAKP